MDSARWSRIQTLFTSAMALPRNQRASFLAAVCAGDPELLQEVQSLVHADEDADDHADAAVDHVALPVVESSAARQPLQGLQFGPYKVIGKLGKGGMGVVYKAEDTRLGRQIAIKCLSPNLEIDETMRQRFVTEARAASQLDHPNICTIYDMGETPDQQLYFTMPYYEGQSLKQCIVNQSLAVVDVLPIVWQIGEGLKVAHNQGIVHRDIKPANVMLTRDGGVKILDFGVAKVAGVENTETGTSLGTVAYMSPEQIQGEKVDSRTDIWSLGVTLYEMIVGKRPFKGNRMHEVMYSVLYAEYEKVTALIPDAPALINNILDRALRRDKTQRYQRIDEMMDDLRVLHKQWQCVDTAHIERYVAPPPTPSTTTSTPDANSDWDQSTISTITRELTKYLGPMAALVVKKKSQETDNVVELCKKVAESLPNEQEQRKFFRRLKGYDIAEFTQTSFTNLKKSNSKEAIQFSAHDIKEIESALLPILGPISAMLIKRMSKNVQDLETLCNQLAEQIHNDADKAAFTKRVIKLYK